MVYFIIIIATHILNWIKLNQIQLEGFIFPKKLPRFYPWVFLQAFQFILYTYLHELPESPDNFVENFRLKLVDEKSADTNNPETAEQFKHLKGQNKQTRKKFTTTATFLTLTPHR